MLSPSSDGWSSMSVDDDAITKLSTGMSSSSAMGNVRWKIALSLWYGTGDAEDGGGGGVGVGLLDSFDGLPCCTGSGMLT